MEALILAAGYGTRLAPYTRTLPKPLFTLAGVTVLEYMVRKLIRCGCTRIFINTHHLSECIDAAAREIATRLGIDICCIHEPTIRDTGGAIANARHFLKQQVFFVINGDVVTDIDLKQIWLAHLKNTALATLVLHDRHAFNKVRVDDSGFITNFNAPDQGLAFTGIQVLSPQIFDFLPDTPRFSIIPVYQEWCRYRRIKACVVQDIYWEDIGTPDAYRLTARQWIAARALHIEIHQAKVRPITGDGSDRTWFRACRRDAPSPGVVIGDHGISLPGTETRIQADAMVAIGNHLARQRVPVPRILARDDLSGLVALEDLGTCHLADMIHKARDDDQRISLYQDVIEALIRFSRSGAQGFDPAWTCQTPSYSRELILEKECRYFMDAFVRMYRGLDAAYDTYDAEFCFIADTALAHGLTGLMHRDCQSRNIMISDGVPFFIDFQSARQGPIQYDLASLLRDPYVTLSPEVQQTLLTHAMDRLSIKTGPEQDRFRESYRFCSLTRNFQILGAFAFLSRVRQKPGFESHIPAALASLKSLSRELEPYPVPGLIQLISHL